MRGPVLQHLSHHFAAITAAVVTLCVVSGHAEAPASEGPVVVATYEGVINPVAAEYLHDALYEAHTLGARALVIKLDTPGGLDTSMRLIIKDITAATFPVVVYVSPSGGRAASAGVFITLAAHVAAMTPGTNIGAAHPVAMGGGEMDKTMKEKVENDSVAYIKSIAEQRGRNVAWAEDCGAQERLRHRTGSLETEDHRSRGGRCADAAEAIGRAHSDAPNRPSGVANRKCRSA